MAAATNSITGGFWTSAFGEGRGAGNSNGHPVLKVCPDGAVINKIRGTIGGSLGMLGFTCSDGTDIGQYGGGAGLPFSGTCDSGYVPAAIGAGWYIDGINFQCPSNAANNLVGNLANIPVTCPTGYAMTGYMGEAGAAVGSIAIQCAPSSSETKIKCCMGTGGANCREYTPQSGICDAFMRSQAKLEPNRDEFSCLKDGVPPLPQCTDVKCQQGGYRLESMGPTSCPTSLTLYDCKQIMTLKDAKSSSIADNSLTQQCGPLLAKNGAEPIPVPMPIPSPPAPIISVPSGGTFGNNNTVPNSNPGTFTPTEPPTATIGGFQAKTVYIGIGILAIIVVAGIVFAMWDDGSSEFVPNMPQYAPKIPM